MSDLVLRPSNPMAPLALLCQWNGALEIVASLSWISYQTADEKSSLKKDKQMASQLAKPRSKDQEEPGQLKG